MMVDLFSNPDHIVAQARTWLGTPYRHQQSTKGVGCDCIGLLRGIWHEIYGIEAEVPPPYTRDWAEVQSHYNGELMLEGAKRNLDPVNVNEIQAGHVILIRVRPRALIKHCGILSEVWTDPKGMRKPVRLIHAYSGHCVTEDPIHRNWIGKEMHFFSFRNLEEVLK